MIQKDVLIRVNTELQHAEQARAGGNEGMARVCARRAAGMAIRAYYQSLGEPVRSTSAVDLLEHVRRDERLATEIHIVAEHLLQRVTPEYRLPIPADLLAETRWLVQALQDRLESSDDASSKRV